MAAPAGWVANTSQIMWKYFDKTSLMNMLVVSDVHESIVANLGYIHNVGQSVGRLYKDEF